MIPPCWTGRAPRPASFFGQPGSLSILFPSAETSPGRVETETFPVICRLDFCHLLTKLRYGVINTPYLLQDSKQ